MMSLQCVELHQFQTDIYQIEQFFLVILVVVVLETSTEQVPVFFFILGPTFWRQEFLRVLSRIQIYKNDKGEGLRSIKKEKGKERERVTKGKKVGTEIVSNALRSNRLVPVDSLIAS